MPMCGISYPAQSSTVQHVHEGNNHWQCQWFHHVGQMTTCASAPVSGCPLLRRQRCRCMTSWCCLRGKARFRSAFRFDIDLTTVLLGVQCASLRALAAQQQCMWVTQTVHAAFTLMCLTYKALQHSAAWL